ncbi:hypothetical protein [Xenorhabdus innexi]|uniref:Uncharacterized protein n=1 Tax=Xenorhabdus innexi TaxID=290109 RepID=A0A1N6N0Y5_9GAMM|nr:hypothetical protein [Xenorhabdus innexi]PHM31307.1 hypothetical protein Xinn_02853 [Xenorhabdus innexi]SIP74758.1 conserved hypothetical protein [Xenorhabdus innexi]
MQYEFEKIKVNGVNPEDMAYAVPVLFSLLAKMITEDDPEKLVRLYGLLDKAIEFNENASCRDQIALVGQITKFSLSEK